MSFLKEKLVDYACDKLTDKIQSACGIEDKDKDDKDGGFLSFFKRDKDEKDDDDDDGRKGGLFSFGKDKDSDRDRDRDKDDDKGNFFQKLFNRDDDDDREKISKKSGFAGLFSEQDQPGAVRFEEGTSGGGGPCDHMTEGDLDLMSDLMAVAKES